MTFCLNCNIHIKKRNKFCGSSCSATYNNSRRPNRIKPEQIHRCLQCSKAVIRRPNEIKKGHKLFCGIGCYKSYKAHTIKNNVNKLFQKGKIKTRATLRKFIIDRDGYSCSKCHNTIWLTQPIPLWLDHIDGNASNNLPSNLRMVCLNCDALNSTFGNKNKGKGRRSLGLKPWE